ncbi:ganglioside GM2 activator [Eublepharis macularius]|uniref:Ganglioside GM2 activator n=1 Tax=Eublepharis macularius TaxID=481883 RepID=A0AA97KWE2_EUBMA|nr:ganglioside GM2 activator [Eublepharis macularius]
MQAVLLTLTLCALQLCPAVLGGPQHQRFVLGGGWPLKLTRVHNFAWKNCDPSDPARIKSLNIIPDPIRIPGDVTVSVSGATTITLEAPMTAIVTLEKKIGDMWLKVPCVDQLGSCTYDDVCAILDSLVPPGQPCPEPLHSYGIPCRCPFKAGSYGLPSTDLYIPNMDLPSFLTNGDYRLKVILKNHEQEFGCVMVSFSLHAESRWFWW